jgi:hypothetical protein
MVTVAVPEAPVAVGVFVPEDEDGVREQAAITIQTASSARKIPACESDENDRAARMCVTFYAAPPE